MGDAGGGIPAGSQCLGKAFPGLDLDVLCRALCSPRDVLSFCSAFAVNAGAFA